MPDLSAGRTFGMNRSERTYWALEGVAGSIAQLAVLRFEGPLRGDAVRGALRAVVRAYPRLRSLVTSGLFGFRQRVLADAEVEPLFARAFDVAQHMRTDLSSLEAYAEDLLSEPFDLTRELPVRARFVPDAETPTLLLLLHHVACDGRSWNLAAEALMRSLNGEKLEAGQLDPPGMIPALLPLGWRAQLASLRDSFRLDRAVRSRMRAHEVARFGTHAPAFGPVGVRFVELPISGKALRTAATNHGQSTTALVVAALAEAFGHGLTEDGKNAVAVRLSVDLRKFFPKGTSPSFGNYVATFAVLSPTLTATRALEDVGAQLFEGLRRFQRKLMSYPLLLAELLTMVPQRILTRVVTAQKKKGPLAPVTCHYSSLGPLGALNPKGARVRLRDVIATCPNVVPFVVTAEMEHTTLLALSYQKNEATDEEVYALLERLGAAISSLASEGLATAPESGPAERGTETASAAEAARIAS